LPVDEHTGGKHHPSFGGEAAPRRGVQAYLGHRHRIPRTQPGKDFLGELAKATGGLGEQGDRNRCGQRRRSAVRSANILSVGRNIVYLGAPP